jgi:PKD repeat protein
MLVERTRNAGGVSTTFAHVGVFTNVSAIYQKAGTYTVQLTPKNQTAEKGRTHSLLLTT